MTFRLSIVVGNPKPGSRTLKVAEALASSLFGPAAEKAVVLDLADHANLLLAGPSEILDGIVTHVMASDVVIFASPTYKATYTGLLKAFLDRFPPNGLMGVTSIPLMTGGDAAHAMAPTVNLAPLLAELGGVVPGRGFYFVISQIDRIDQIVKAAAQQYATVLGRVAALAAAMPSVELR